MQINSREFYEDSQDPRSPTFSWACDSSRATRSLWTRGPSTEEERNADVAALLGVQEVRREVVGVTPRVYVHRQIPAAYPGTAAGVPLDAATSSWLYASSVPRGSALSSATSPGLGVEGGAVYSAGFRYSVEYTARPYSVKEDDEVAATAGVLSAGTPATAVARPDEGDALRRGWASYSRYITKMVEPGAKALTLPNGFTKYVKVAPEADPQPVPIGLPVPFFRYAVSYVWHLVPAAGIPDAAIAKCANAVNDATFDGYAAETLLFSSARFTPLLGPFGDRLFNVEYRFIYQPIQDFDGATYTTRGWNYFPGVLSGKLRARQITASQAGAAPADNTTRIFKTQDFTTLFRPDQV